jgi:hypothetical protein
MSESCEATNCARVYNLKTVCRHFTPCHHWTSTVLFLFLLDGSARAWPKKKCNFGDSQTWLTESRMVGINALLRHRVQVSLLPCLCLKKLQLAHLAVAECHLGPSLLNQNHLLAIPRLIPEVGLMRIWNPSGNIDSCIRATNMHPHRTSRKSTESCNPPLKSACIYMLPARR